MCYFLHAVPCEWKWGEYRECSQTCGDGSSSRYPIITKEAQYGGDCPLRVVNRIPETRGCNVMECPREYDKHVYVCKITK